MVTQCHATGLRQMKLCPHLADESPREGCARNERFLTLHAGDAREVERQLGVSDERVTRRGGGVSRRHLSHARGREAVEAPRVIYVGKYSAAKGLAVAVRCRRAAGSEKRPGLELHVVGSGAGEEAEALAGADAGDVVRGAAARSAHATRVGRSVAHLSGVCAAFLLRGRAAGGGRGAGLRLSAGDDRLAGCTGRAGPASGLSR